MMLERLMHAAALSVALVMACAIQPHARAAESASPCVPANVALRSEVSKNGYRIQPGDQLQIFVRQEESLQRQALVLPDGTISLPLLGIVPVFNKTVQDVESDICGDLQKLNFIQDPNVTVAVQQLGNNIFYVIGKVARPGEFELRHDMDVIKGLAVAGGLATFASEGGIRILRRNTDGPKEFRFDYGKFMDGKDRESNILLQPGDTIIVP